MSVKGLAGRRFKSPNQLTPYEQRLWDHYNLGLNHKQIAEAVGSKNAEGVRSRLIIIKEKLAANG